MSPKIVNCKMCGRKFERLEWLRNKECDTPEQCHCPEVKKAMQQAISVIDNAKKTAGFKMEKTVTPIPTQCQDTDEQQLFIQVEPLVVIEVKKNHSRKK